MDFFDGIFQVEDAETPEHQVYRALVAGEEQLRSALDALEEPLSLRDAAQSLRKSLEDGDSETFRLILEHSERGECTERAIAHQTEEHCTMQGKGSMLLLAALLERPRQAAMLLERGYDCNDAGLVLRESVRFRGRNWDREAMPYARYCGNDGSYLRIVNARKGLLGISCATPLSVALLCGSLETAELLLRQRDVWKAESSAVCRGAVMVLEGIAGEFLTKEQRANRREILRQIFWPDRVELPDREAFLRSVYLQPASFVDCCCADTLRCQLESGLCTEEDGEHMLRVLEGGRWRPIVDEVSRAGKLLLLKRYFPRLCREDWAAAIFLRECLRRIREERPYKSLLNAWKQLCGKERDLTFVGGELRRFDWQELKRFLQEAEEGGSLVMDADAMSGWDNAGARCIMEMLKRVRFRQRDGAGVSGMMQSLLAIADPRTLRRAVKQGLLEREDPKLLLEHLSQQADYRQDLRALVLTYARNNPLPDEPKADWQEPRRWGRWCHWATLEKEEAEQELHRLLHRQLSEREYLWALFRLRQYMDQGIFAPDMPVDDSRYLTMQANALAGFACCAESQKPMELLIKGLPETLLTPIRANWGEQFCFHGTPLALAAAMGRTEQVRLLLDSGIQPDELGRGTASRFYLRNSDFSESDFRVTPLLAAILFGQEETARLLLEWGAVCDFSRPEYRRVLLAGSAESLELAKNLPGVGFEQISAEELENLRELTAEQGERTRFWNSLRRPSC